MTAIIESWVLALCAAVAAVGYGSGLARFLQIRPNLGDRGILGLLVFGFVGCILHFVVALSTLVQTAVLACGMVAAAVLRGDIRSDASLTLAAAAGLCLFFLLHPQAYQTEDDGLYYLQTFLWNHEFPVVAGLGNLHGRLAFNQILFLIAPLVDRLEIGWIANLLVVTFVMLSLWARLRQIDLPPRQRAVLVCSPCLVDIRLETGLAGLVQRSIPMMKRCCSRPRALFLLNGIEDVIGRPDFADRAISLSLGPIGEEQRRAETELWGEFERARPVILGALLDAIVRGLRAVDSVHVSGLPRMADFELWARACETALWPTGAFTRAYAANRRTAIEAIIDTDPVTTCVRQLVSERGSWAGSATDLLRVGERTRRTSDNTGWPKNPRALAGHLRRAQTFLRTAGIDITFNREGRAGNRVIRIRTSLENTVSTVSSVGNDGPELGCKQRRFGGGKFSLAESGQLGSHSALQVPSTAADAADGADAKAGC
jgi:hypothetical protein